MPARSTNGDKVQGLVAGATGGTALYHYSTALGFGLDKDVIGHIAPWISFLLGWLWIVFYQETLQRLNVYRLKRACIRRIAEIDSNLLQQSLLDERRKKLTKERDDCLEIISRVSADDLQRRLTFSISS
jgi:hypothetical protein